MNRPVEVREDWHDEMDALDPHAESKDFDMFWAAIAALTIVVLLFYRFWPLH